MAERFGYEEYDAPILEPLEIYLAKTGDEIVNEQTYVFEDRGGRKVVIRPEMTPTVSRAPDFLPNLQKELLAVVGRYVEISDDMIRVTLGNSGDTSLLEINIEIEGGKLKKGGGSGPALSAAV